MKTRVLILGVFLASSIFALAAWPPPPVGNEVWISPVGTDGTGTGTAADPYITTSTKTLAQVLGDGNAYLYETTGASTPTPSVIPTNSTIHLMAGTFHTFGEIEPQNNWKIRGAGIDVTIVQMEPWNAYPMGTNSYIPVFGFGPYHDGVEISDMTIDCNLQANTSPACYNAFWLSGGNDTRISRVKAINWGTTSCSEEGIFAILGDPSRSITNCVIEDCIVGPPAPVTFTQGSDGFCISGCPANALDTGSIGWICAAEIRNCRIYGIGAATDGIGAPTYFSGMGVVGVIGAKMDGNMFYNVGGNAVYSSCGSLINCSIENNMFLDVGCGIGFASSDYCGSSTNSLKENIRISDNFITVKTGGVAMSISGMLGNAITNLTIENNVAQAAVGAGLVSGLDIYDVDNVSVLNNILDANGGKALQIESRVTISQMDNNVNLAGASVIPPYLVPAAPFLTNNQFGVTLNGIFNGTFTGIGTGLSGLDASQLICGTVPDACLATNVVRYLVTDAVNNTNIIIMSGAIGGIADGAWVWNGVASWTNSGAGMYIDEGSYIVITNAAHNDPDTNYIAYCMSGYPTQPSSSQWFDINGQTIFGMQAAWGINANYNLDLSGGINLPFTALPPVVLTNNQSQPATFNNNVTVNGVLSGNGAGLTNVQALKTETQFTNEFWISTSTNTASLGTLSDPYDGSTQAKFDAVMSNMPPYTTIHLLAGTYQTFGDSDSNPGWKVKSGQKILGSGIDVTILQLVSGRPNQTCVMRSEVSTNVEISDLTVDWNGSSGNVSGGGVVLYGTRHAIRRVKVINQYSGAGESFGIGISLYNLPATFQSDGNIIEECEVSHYLGGTGGISAIDMAGAGMSGIIRNNRCFLPLCSGGAAVAINGAQTCDVLIEGNYVDGADIAFYGDTGGYTNIVVAYNTFRNCGCAVDLRNTIRENITVAFNNIEITNDLCIGGVVFYFVGDQGESYTNVLIIGNNIRYNSTTPGCYFLNANRVAGLVLMNNSVDSRLINYLTNCVNVSMYNNYDLYGNYLTNMNMPMIGNTLVTSFGLSLVGSTGASSALTALGLPNTPSVIVTNNATGVTLNGTFTGTGTGLRDLDASQLVYGTVPDACLATNVVRYLVTDAVNNTNIVIMSGAIGGIADGAWVWNGVASWTNAGAGIYIDEGSFIVITNAAHNDPDTNYIAYSMIIYLPAQPISSSWFDANNQLIDNMQTVYGITGNYNLDLSGGINLPFTALPPAVLTNNQSQPVTFNNNVTANGILSGNGSGLTSLNASQLTSGTIPQTQLPGVVVTNNATGVTLSGTFSGNGSGLTSLNASQLTSGTIPQTRLPGVVVTNNATGVTLSGAFSGNGSNLTSLNASQLTSGTIPQTQLPGAVVTNNATGVTLSGTFSGNGSGLTSLNASQLTSGTIPQTRLPGVVVTNNATGVTLNGTFSGNGSGLTGITAAQIGAAASTNATIWSSLSVTNVAATNWATLNVTPSNAVISVEGINVAVLQTNGVLNAINGLSTTVSNKMAAISITPGTSTFHWTNTTPKNVVVYINGLKGSVGYNDSLICGPTTTTNGYATVVLQPNENFSITNGSGGGPFFGTIKWHPF